MLADGDTRAARGSARAREYLAAGRAECTGGGARGRPRPLARGRPLTGATAYPRQGPPRVGVRAGTGGNVGGSVEGRPRARGYLVARRGGYLIARRGWPASGDGAVREQAWRARLAGSGGLPCEEAGVWRARAGRRGRPGRGLARGGGAVRRRCPAKRRLAPRRAGAAAKRRTPERRTPVRGGGARGAGGGKAGHAGAALPFACALSCVTSSLFKLVPYFRTGSRGRTVRGPGNGPGASL